MYMSFACSCVPCSVGVLLWGGGANGGVGAKLLSHSHPTVSMEGWMGGGAELPSPLLPHYRYGKMDGGGGALGLPDGQLTQITS